MKELYRLPTSPGGTTDYRLLAGCGSRLDNTLSHEYNQRMCNGAMVGIPAFVPEMEVRFLLKHSRDI